MAFSGLLASIADKYDRQARLGPAFLVLFPVIVLVVVLFGPDLKFIGFIVTLLASLGGLYLIASMAREFGEIMEPKLFKRWAGTPTTQLLRHRNTVIEKITKKRYHAFLSKVLGERAPTARQEAVNPEAADDFYQSGTRWLLENTRDHDDFPIVFLENIAYGFSRNALALRPFGLVSCIACLVYVLFNSEIVTWADGVHFNVHATANLDTERMILLFVSFAMFLVWAFFVTGERARIAGFRYAEALLRTCDKLRER